MRKYILIFSTIAAFAISGCKKVIDVRETDFIGGDVALKTVANNESGIIGAYAAMNPEMAILYNAVMSDELKVGEFYNAATVHEWQFTSTDIVIRDNFTAMAPWYQVIDRVNRVLEALPNADSTRVGDNTLKNRLRGEALFIRAYAHFEMARYYSGNYDPDGLGMPYRKIPSLQPSARDKMGPYFQNILTDLVESKSLLPATAVDVSRTNRIAAAGLHARVALYMRDWTNAITYATEYINAIPLASAATFPGIWADATNAEVAFKLKRTPSIGGRVGSLFRNTSANASNIGTVVWQPSDKIWNSYDQTNDIRFPTYFKDEPLLAAAGRPSRIIIKYAGGAYGSPTENVADVKMFRTGEMYLIRAEAKAENGDLPGAAQDLNALRAMRITGYTNITLTTLQQAIDEILLERFRELAYEGHRLWDLKRKNKAVERLASDAQNPGSQTLAAGNFRFTLPIPNREMQANPLMEQNPGYTN